MQRDFRTPLFLSLTINEEAIRQEFDYLTDDQVSYVAEAFKAYLTDADAWDFLATFAEDAWERDMGE